MCCTCRQRPSRPVIGCRVTWTIDVMSSVGNTSVMGELIFLMSKSRTTPLSEWDNMQYLATTLWKLRSLQSMNQVDLAALAGALRTLCGAVPLLFLLEMKQLGVTMLRQWGRSLHILTLSNQWWPCRDTPHWQSNGNAQLSINWYISRRNNRGTAQRRVKVLQNCHFLGNTSRSWSRLSNCILKSCATLWVSITYFFQDLCWHFMTPFQLVILTQVKVCYSIQSWQSLVNPHQSNNINRLDNSYYTYGNLAPVDTFSLDSHHSYFLALVLWNSCPRVWRIPVRKPSEYWTITV